jgi:CelD/BcsL family acetyltransferase involved in cellulose biosynthesis
MSPRISQVRPATPAEWDEAWRSYPYATPFQSRMWAEVWQRSTAGEVEPAPLHLTFDDGVQAVMPLSHLRLFKGIAHRRLSSPAGTYGGWLAADDISASHAEALCKYVLDTSPELWWRLNPYEPLAATLREHAVEPDETHVIPLAGGFAAVEAGATHGHRSSARKARREGVVTRKAVGVADWRAYYGLYEDSLARWGDAASSHYSRSLFDELQRLEPGFVELWLASLDNRVIAGALCLYAPRQVACWHAAALASFFDLRPVNLLYFDAIRDACSRGLDWFDLNPSGGHEGVREFKRRFGALPLPAPVIVRHGGAGVRVGRAAHAARATLKRRPGDAGTTVRRRRGAAGAEDQP